MADSPARTSGHAPDVQRVGVGVGDCEDLPATGSGLGAADTPGPLPPFQSARSRLDGVKDESVDRCFVRMSISVDEEAS